MALTVVLGTLAILSWLLTLWQWAAARRFPLHQPAGGHAWSPRVTLLKPLKGCDARTAECLQSWMTQRYATEVEILFGVASGDDPVCEVVRKLIATHSKAQARLIVCPECLGANAKVSTLIQLMRVARHDLIVVSDADVWAPPDLLTEAIGPLRNDGIGLVNCFYRLAAAPNLAMSWEAFAVNSDFWSQVLQSQSLKPLDFALGAVMATTRAHLKSIGGFESLPDFLADDYQLGHKIARTGASITLCPTVVECRNEPMGWNAVWTHQKRWARTIRVCQPLPYFFSQLHNPTLWPWLWALCRPSVPTLAIAGGCLLTRMGVGFYCERKLTGRASLNSCWAAPLKDLLQTVLWALAFFGNKVTWRGQRFKVQAGGKLVKTQETETP